MHAGARREGHGPDKRQDARSNLTALGPGGLRQMAELSYQKAHYAATVIGAVPGYEVLNDGTWFHEFVVKCPNPPNETTKGLLERGIIGGLDISSSVPNGMLFCVTEMNTRSEIDALAEALGQIAKAV